MNKISAILASLAFATSAHAVIIPFDLVGTAGPGLLPGNEPGSLTGGTGGEIGAGITYDDVANLLDLTNVGWGSSQGFTDLSSLANNSHIHGPVANNNGNGFTQTAGVAINLTRSSNAVTGGTFTNPTHTLTPAQEIDLLNGKFYINIHTATNGGGELRGFLVPVPEPSTAGLIALGVAGLVARRRNRAA
jgi:CHRD domain/PEP-CTERM motif